MNIFIFLHLPSIHFFIFPTPHKPLTHATMSKSFSILGKNLKAETAADLEPYLSQLKEMEDVEEVHFGGNSLGVDACKAIAEVLKDKKSLKVRRGSRPWWKGC